MDDPPSIHRSVAAVLDTTVPTGRTSSLDLTTIHRQHGDFVWKMLQRMGVAERQLEDATQDAFLVVHRRLASFDGTASMTTWLYGICLRVAAAHRRRASVR